MIQIFCRTTLDILPAETWPDKLPSVPAVGDLIQSSFLWKGVYCLELEVVRVKWAKTRYIDNNFWYPQIELHLPRNRFENLTSFYEWYGSITGKGKSYFI